MPIHLSVARTFNNDFETGDLTDWEKTGTAFDFQPTWGDNLLNTKEIGGSDYLRNTKVQIKELNLDRVLVRHRVMHRSENLHQLNLRSSVIQ